jgi:hypothetical protein
LQGHLGCFGGQSEQFREIGIGRLGQRRATFLAQSGHNQRRLDARITIFVQKQATNLATKTVGCRFLYGNEGRKLDRIGKLPRLQTFGVLCLAARHLMSASKPKS